MLLRWTPQAADDLVGIVSHIREENSSAAREGARDIITHLAKLQRFPYLGRRGKPGTRELVIGQYVVVYRLKDKFIELLHIWHGAQDWR